LNTKPVVHVGYHKTATTWFQKRFYPLVPSHRFVSRKYVQESLLLPTAYRFDPESARIGLGVKHEAPPPILCEEELSGNPHSGGMRGSFSKDIAEHIRATLPDARIVIFIRNQVDMSAALYRHYVREGGTAAPRRYFKA